MDLVAEKREIGLLQSLFGKQKKKSIQLREESVKNRKARLKKLEAWLVANEEGLQQAVYNDFRKPFFEVTSTELFPVLAEIRYAIEHLEKWAAPTKIDAPLTYFGTRTEIRYEPKGVCLIIT